LQLPIIAWFNAGCSGTRILKLLSHRQRNTMQRNAKHTKAVRLATRCVPV